MSAVDVTVDDVADVSSPESDNVPGHGHCGHERADAVEHELSWLQRRIHGAIIMYQRVREGRPSPCRFFPTCSSYALEAFDTHGTWRGGWLALRRLGRCRPLGPSGFDPVPEGRPTAPTGPPSSSISSPISSPTPSQKGS